MKGKGKIELSHTMHDWDNLSEIIKQSLSIKKHYDFFEWLQTYVAKSIPHDVLIASWGNYTTGQLHFDVASVDPSINTGVLMEGDHEVSPLITDLYHRWAAMGERWYVLNNFNEMGIDTLEKCSLISSLTQMKSVLVYGTRDLRGKNDCLYVLFSKQVSNGLNSSVLDVLMPHIDATLRRVECLLPEITEEPLSLKVSLTSRENEVMEWVCMGKTNDDISTLLGISINTVKNHLKRVFNKLNVISRAQAVAQYQVTVEQIK